MKGVDTIARVRREFFVRGRTIKEICPRAARLAEHGAQDPAQRGDGVRVRAERSAAAEDRARGGRSSIGSWRRTQAGRGRERLTLIRVFEELRGLGYEGGYDAVRRYARSWAARAGRGDGGGLRAAELRAGRGLPVRLEPRGRADRRGRR